MHKLTALLALAALLLSGCATQNRAEEGNVADGTATSQTGSAALLGPTWSIEDIAGHGVIDNSAASLEFLPEGRLAGNASCNRLIGRYTVQGNELSIEPAGTTMMACPEAVMNQEQRLLKLLPEVNSYHIDDNGTLVLQTGGGQSITARHD